MLNDLEEFFKAHHYTVSALEAVSTFCVVVVSVVLALVAQRASRTRIKAYASINIIMHASLAGQTRPTYVTVHVRNIGIMPVMIPLSFFHWKVPFKGSGWTVLPWDYSQGDAWIPQKQYPFEIKPRSSVTFFLAEKSVFQNEMRRTFTSADLFERCGFRFLRARIVTDDNKLFNVKLDRLLRKELHTLREEALRSPIPLVSASRPFGDDPVA